MSKYKDSFGERMKSYENASKTSLTRKVPVAIRIDGKAHHTFTKHLKKPFDEIYSKAMRQTMLYLCKEIQGCVFGYCQSDEITLILTDYDTPETDAWFGYQVQKLCSVAASMATMKFNQAFNTEVIAHYFHSGAGYDDYNKTLKNCLDMGATFDARCFNIPKEEVTNLLYWRQLDAMRNSTNALGQAHFSTKELQGKTCEEVREMLRNLDECYWWENQRLSNQRGSACYKIENCGWIVDTAMPILKGESRELVEKRL